MAKGSSITCSKKCSIIKNKKWREANKDKIAEKGKAYYEANKDKIDLVILDIIMPGMGGGEPYNRLKEINSDIKVLLTSGNSINGQANEILDRGCNGFIQKPFNMEDLSRNMRRILDKK